MIRLVYGLIIVAVANLAPSAPATAQTVFVMEVCNHYHRRVLVAASYMPIGDNRWRNLGWIGIGANDCEIIGRTDNRHFYFYAHVHGDRNLFWGGNHNLCVEFPGPYEYFSGSESETCRGNRRAVGFRHMTADAAGTYTWRLRP